MAARRFCDVVLAAAGLASALPFVLLGALAAWLEDGASPWYPAFRVGRGGRVFRMWKLRSMVSGADRQGGCSTAADDRRITRAGRWIRRYKLDEFPQLYHVLTGEMSLVGPRPQVPPDAARYTPAERRLLEVAPGVTDPASVVFSDEAEILRGAADPDAEYDRRIRPWKSRLALAGIEEQGLGFYFRVLAWTAANFVARPAALAGVARWLAACGAPPELIQIARRAAQPPAGLPPGGPHPAECPAPEDEAVTVLSGERA